MICIGCGCSDFNPCVDSATGETCAWMPGMAGGPICSFCAGGYDETELIDDPPLIEIVSEGEADRFIRARRNGCAA